MGQGTSPWKSSCLLKERFSTLHSEKQNCFFTILELPPWAGLWLTPCSSSIPRHLNCSRTPEWSTPCRGTTAASPSTATAPSPDIALPILDAEGVTTWLLSPHQTRGVKEESDLADGGWLQAQTSEGHSGCTGAPMSQQALERKRPWQVGGQDIGPQPEDWSEQVVEGQGVKTMRFDRAGPQQPAMEQCGLPSWGATAGTAKDPEGRRSRDSQITRQCEMDNGEKILWRRQS